MMDLTCKWKKTNTRHYEIPKDCRYCNLKKFCPQLKEYKEEQGITDPDASRRNGTNSGSGIGTNTTKIPSENPCSVCVKKKRCYKRGYTNSCVTGKFEPKKKDKRIRLNQAEIQMIWKALVFWEEVSGLSVKPYGLKRRFRNLAEPDEQGYVARR